MGTFSRALLVAGVRSIEELTEPPAAAARKVTRKRQYTERHTPTAEQQLDKLVSFTVTISGGGVDKDLTSLQGVEETHTLAGLGVYALQVEAGTNNSGNITLSEGSINGYPFNEDNDLIVRPGEIAFLKRGGVSAVAAGAKTLRIAGTNNDTATVTILATHATTPKMPTMRESGGIRNMQIAGLTSITQSEAEHCAFISKGKYTATYTNTVGAFGWDYTPAERSGEYDYRRGRHNAAGTSNLTAISTGVADKITQMVGWNSTIKYILYTGSRNVRTDDQVQTLNEWPCDNTIYERDWAGFEDLLVPFGYTPVYSHHRCINHADPACRVKFKEILLNYIDSGWWPSNIFGLHFDEVSPYDQNFVLSSAWWNGLQAFMKDFRATMHARGKVSTGNMGGFGFHSALPTIDPNYWENGAAMFDVIQQEGWPDRGSAAGSSVAAYQTSMSNMRKVWDAGSGIEILPFRSESSAVKYTITGISTTTAGNAFPGTVNYGKTGQLKLLVTLNRPANSYKYIGSTPYGQTLVGLAADTVAWPKTGWTATIGPAANQIYLFRQDRPLEVDDGATQNLLSFIRTTTPGFNWTDMIGKTIQDRGFYERFIAASGLMMCRDLGSVFAVHLSPGSSANPWAYAASAFPNASAKQDWTQWPSRLKDPIEEPVFHGNAASGKAWKITRKFRDGELELYPDEGYVEIIQ